MSDVIERMEELTKLKTGDPLPEWLVDANGSWADPLNALLREAIHEIKVARAGWKCVKDAS